MHDDERSYSSDTPQNGVVTLTGYGLRLAVERGHLVVEDGVGDERRTGRFSRIDRELKRVVVIGHNGLITLDAIRWLHGVGVPLIHLANDGTLFLVATPQGATTPAQRRAQVLAQDSPVGLDIARTLIAAKIDGQRDVLRAIPDSEDAQAVVATYGDRVRRATNLTEIRQIEPLAARAYWRAWSSVPVRLAPQDATRRPRHWRSFGIRVSPLTEPSPRKAVNPANAVLNYLYAVLEAETRIAALAVGLDPLVGLLHADRPHRDSLACDLMEPIRPAVDRYLLGFLAKRTITNEDVFELVDGQCRLLPPLTRDLTATAAEWARLVRPVVEEVADRLGGAKRKPGARSGMSPTSPKTHRRRRPRGPTAVTRDFAGVGGAAVASASPLARRIQALRAANRDWEQLHGRPQPTVFKDTILPRLRSVTLRQIHQATGLSRALCTKIRRGDVVPHPRYWDALRDLAAARPPAPDAG